MMMEASFDTEESFDDPSCLTQQPPGSVSPAKRQIKEVKETKTTVSRLQHLIVLSLFLHRNLFFLYRRLLLCCLLSNFLPSSVASSKPASLSSSTQENLQSSTEQVFSITFLQSTELVSKASTPDHVAVTFGERRLHNESNMWGFSGLACLLEGVQWEVVVGGFRHCPAAAAVDCIVVKP